jgi:hypothetical protein
MAAQEGLLVCVARGLEHPTAESDFVSMSLLTTSLDTKGSVLKR